MLEDEVTFEAQIKNVHKIISSSIKTSKDKRKLHKSVSKGEMKSVNIPNNKLEITTVSDSIIISIRYSDSDRYLEKIINFRYLIWVLALIQKKCSKNNIWIRGGVSFGKTTHTRKLAAGQGISAAFAIESQAKFPRIGIDQNIYKAFSCDAIKNIKQLFTILYKYPYRTNDDYLLNDGGLFFINFLNQCKRNEVFIIGEHAAKNFDNLTDESIKEKYRWLCQYISFVEPSHKFSDELLSNHFTRLFK